MLRGGGDSGTMKEVQEAEHLGGNSLFHLWSVMQVAFLKSPVLTSSGVTFYSPSSWNEGRHTARCCSLSVAF